jgi:hypothetical protein
MKNAVIYLTFILVIVFLFGYAYSFNLQNGDGKTLFEEKKCNMCHSVESAGIVSKKKDAKDLSTVGDNYDAGFFAKFLVKEEKIDGKEHKTSMKGTAEEIKTVAEWLSLLKSEESN